VKQIVFDKTGTLTLQGTRLVEFSPLMALDIHQLSVLLTMVRENLHPVASALREGLMALGVIPEVVRRPPHEHIGMGIELEHHGQVWRLGRPSWIGVPVRGECAFACDGEVLAGFDFCESIRADAHAALSAFTRQGFDVAILSGDCQRKVNQMAESLELTTSHALGGLSPDEKADWLRGHDGAHTLMIGDGANDSLAFNEALCTGTPVIDRGLLEHKADFYFLGRSLSGLRTLFDIARARARASYRVIGFAIAYNAIAIALSTAGRMSPLAAAVLMPLSSLVTIGLVLASLRRAKSA
jgi:Cu2+-exporting ATPase